MLFFSNSVPEEVEHEIKVKLRVPEIMHYEKYLRLPSLVGKWKKEIFNFIKEKVYRKLQGWETKLLSQAGKEVLLKVVIQAIPTYTMGCFKLPVMRLSPLLRSFGGDNRVTEEMFIKLNGRI